MKMGILCSGNLGFTVLSQLSKERTVAFVFTDRGSTDIINFCEKHNIPFFAGNPRGGKADKFIQKHKLNVHCADVIASVNYLFIIDSQIINLASKLAFNVHGSLLPRYRGRTPHVWSIINNEKYTGITAHVIDEGCDTGDIIQQVKISIDPCDTGATILEKYSIQYLPLIRSVLMTIESDNVQLSKQDNTIATYFGKRTAADGLINWNWQKERIYNWVRAQAHPYPGAFTFIGSEQFIIDEVRYHDHGFDYTVDNGTVLCLDPLVVKVSNGCLEITKYRSDLTKVKLKSKFGDENR